MGSAASGIVGGASNIVSGITGGGSAKRAMRDANKRLQDFESNRQQVIDPYAGVTDLSGNLSNPYANLSVSTKAADFQASQADQSLANVLDSMKQSGGGGAGSATALARAALESKQGISADIAKQEQSNQQLRAQGASELQSRTLAEKQRVQDAGAKGKAFMFGAQEQREMIKQGRLTSEFDRAREAREASKNALTTGIGQLAGGVASLYTGGF
jgi:hypothetical protein